MFLCFSVLVGVLQQVDASSKGSYQIIAKMIFRHIKLEAANLIGVYCRTRRRVGQIVRHGIFGLTGMLATVVDTKDGRGA